MRAAQGGLRVVAGLFMVALGLYLAGWWLGLARVEQAGSGLWRWLEPWGRRLLPVLAFSYLMYRKALQEHSFYYLLVFLLYAYGAVSYSFLNALHQLNIEHYGGFAFHHPHKLYLATGFSQHGRLGA